MALPHGPEPVNPAGVMNEVAAPLLHPLPSLCLRPSCYPCGRAIDQDTAQAGGHRQPSWEAPSKRIAVRLRTPCRCNLTIHGDVLLNLGDARRGVCIERIRRRT